MTDAEPLEDRTTLLGVMRCFAWLLHCTVLCTPFTCAHCDLPHHPAKPTLSGCYSLSVVFFCARPENGAAFAALRAEAASAGDMAVLPGVAEHYDNITYQTLEMLRVAALDPAVTHVLKVCGHAVCPPCLAGCSKVRVPRQGRVSSCLWSWNWWLHGRAMPPIVAQAAG